MPFLSQPTHDVPTSNNSQPGDVPNTNRQQYPSLKPLGPATPTQQWYNSKESGRDAHNTWMARRFGIEFRIHRWVHLDVRSESTNVVSSPWLDLPDFCDHLEENRWRTIINARFFHFSLTILEPGRPSLPKSHQAIYKPCSLPPSKLKSFHVEELLVSALSFRTRSFPPQNALINIR